MGSWKHRLSNIDPVRKVADCASCGPAATIRFRADRNQWRCRVAANTESPEARARRKTRSHANYGVKYVRGLGRFPVADYDALLAHQGGVCAICGGVTRDRALAVDHCHESGRVRGLLCGACNTAIGLMADDPSRLRKAAEYLA